MKRVKFKERDNLAAVAQELDFTLTHVEGQKYWDESAAYAFTLSEIEDAIEAPTNALLELCYGAVDFVVNNPDYLDKMGIAKNYQQKIIHSWKVDRAKDLYGRFDFSYNNGIVKMLEFNADTPTSLFEASVFQWKWLQDKIQAAELHDADQFNSIHERLLMAFEMLRKNGNNTFHFAAILDSEEDRLTTAYISDCAYQAGFNVTLMDMKDLGFDGTNLVDLENEVIRNLFKLYPWEHLHQETDFFSTVDLNIFEPHWKSILSNKAILPVLWMLNEGHPNLLPAYFYEERHRLKSDYAVKPFHSREGEDVTLMQQGSVLEQSAAGMDKNYIVQELCILPEFDGNYVLLGSWVVAGEACGLGIREDSSRITQNLSRFVPHYIEGTD